MDWSLLVGLLALALAEMKHSLSFMCHLPVVFATSQNFCEKHQGFWSVSIQLQGISSLLAENIKLGELSWFLLRYTLSTLFLTHFGVRSSIIECTCL